MWCFYASPLLGSLGTVRYRGSDDEPHPPGAHEKGFCLYSWVPSAPPPQREGVLPLFFLLLEFVMSDSPSLLPRSRLDALALWVQRVNGFVLTVLAFALVACVVWQVASRYVTSTPSTSTDELARFMFMWISLLGAAQASATKQHLAIDLLAMRLKGVAKRTLNVVIELCIIVFAALVMVYGGSLLTAKTFANAQVTPAL